MLIISNIAVIKIQYKKILYYINIHYKIKSTHPRMRIGIYKIVQGFNKCD